MGRAARITPVVRVAQPLCGSGLGAPAVAALPPSLAAPVQCDRRSFAAEPDVTAL
jgi:hypothetical protein